MRENLIVLMLCALLVMIVVVHHLNKIENGLKRYDTLLARRFM